MIEMWVLLLLVLTKMPRPFLFSLLYQEIYPPVIPLVSTGRGVSTTLSSRVPWMDVVAGQEPPHPRKN